MVLNSAGSLFADTVHELGEDRRLVLLFDGFALFFHPHELSGLTGGTRAGGNGDEVAVLFAVQLENDVFRRLLPVLLGENVIHILHRKSFVLLQVGYAKGVLARRFFPV